MSIGIDWSKESSLKHFWGFITYVFLGSPSGRSCWPDLRRYRLLHERRNRPPISHAHPRQTPSRFYRKPSPNLRNVRPHNGLCRVLLPQKRQRYASPIASRTRPWMHPQTKWTSRMHCLSWYQHCQDLCRSRSRKAPMANLRGYCWNLPHFPPIHRNSTKEELNKNILNFIILKYRMQFLLIKLDQVL